MRRRIILALVFAALVVVALLGAALQLVRGERPVLAARKDPEEARRALLRLDDRDHLVALYG